jgi:hypothetical protein
MCCLRALQSCQSELWRCPGRGQRYLWTQQKWRRNRARRTRKLEKGNHRKVQLTIQPKFTIQSTENSAPNRSNRCQPSARSGPLPLLCILSACQSAHLLVLLKPIVSRSPMRRPIFLFSNVSLLQRRWMPRELAGPKPFL